jgi:hypothetical protein
VKHALGWLFERSRVEPWLVILLVAMVCDNVLIARVMHDVPLKMRHTTPLYRSMERAVSLDTWAYTLGIWSALMLAGALLSRSRVAALGCLLTFLWWVNVAVFLIVKTPMLSWFIPTLFLLPTTLPLLMQSQLWNLPPPTRWQRRRA